VIGAVIADAAHAEAAGLRSTKILKHITHILQNSSEGEYAALCAYLQELQSAEKQDNLALGLVKYYLIQSREQC